MFKSDTDTHVLCVLCINNINNGSQSLYIIVQKHKQPNACRAVHPGFSVPRRNYITCITRDMTGKY